MKKPMMVLVSLVTAAALLAGCGSGGAGENGTTAAGTDESSQNAAGEAAAGETAAGETAAGENAANSENESMDENGRVVITITSTYDLPEFEAALEAAYPLIDLQVEEMYTGTINGEIARRLKNGHGSDLIITNLPSGEILDYVYDLSSESVTELYQSAAMNKVMQDGHYSYLPLPGTYYGYLINKTILDELGLDLPETKDDLLNVMAAAVENNLGINPDTGYCFGLSDIGATFLGAYLTGDYATDFLTTAEGARWTADFNDQKAAFSGQWENSIDFLKTCIDNGYMDPQKLLVVYNGHLDSDVNAFKAEEEMINRNAILSYGNLEMLDKIQNDTEDEILMIPCLPSDENGNKLLSAVSNNYIAINKALETDEAKLGAALNILNYLSTEEGQKCWMSDSKCTHSYINNFNNDTSSLPESIQYYVTAGMVYDNPFKTNLLSYLGKMLISAVKGSTEIGDALAAIDDYYLNGSEDVDYDFSVVGTVASDMLYENSNTRFQETEIGNFISDTIREMTGADVALVNGGGIRSSFYKGDVTGDDLSAVCPYGNLIIVAQMDGATLKAAITNGIQKTWKPAGQFLQVSGIRYSYKPAQDETQTAELVSLSYADGTEVGDDDVITVAYTNYMGGSSGYVDAGDGFTMLNVYDAKTPISVKLISETNKTYCDALKEYFANHSDSEISGKLEGRIEIIE